MTSADSITGDVATVSEYSFAEYLLVPAAPLVRFDNSEWMAAADETDTWNSSGAGPLVSSLSVGNVGALLESTGLVPEESGFAQSFAGIGAQELSANGELLGAEAQAPSDDGTALAETGSQGNNGATEDSPEAAELTGSGTEEQGQAQQDTELSGAQIATDDSAVDSGAGTVVSDNSLSLDPVEGIAFNMEDIDAWQVINASPSPWAVALPSSDRTPLAMKPLPGGSFVVSIDAMNVNNLLA